METTVFHNAAIIDCTGRDPYHGTVVVAGDRIRGVGPADQVSTPRDAMTVDLGGMTLMPGLIDVHTHLGMVVSDETVSAEDHYPGATYALYVAQRIEECLMSGFTTVRDAGMTEGSFKTWGGAWPDTRSPHLHVLLNRLGLEHCRCITADFLLFHLDS